MALHSEDNSVDRRTPLAILICVIIFVAWQKFYLEPRTFKPAQQNAPTTAQTSTPAIPGGQPAAPSATPSHGGGTMTAPTGHFPRELIAMPLSSGTGDAFVSSGPFFFTGWNLKGYQLEIAKQASAVDLRSATNRPGQVIVSFDDPSLSYLSDDSIRGVLTKTPQGYLWTYDDQNVHMTRELTSGSSQPWVDAKITVDFKTKVPAHTLVSAGVQGAKDDPEAQDRSVLYFTNGSLERVKMKDEISKAEVGTPVKYIGAGNRYFVFATLNSGSAEPRALVEPWGSYGGRASLSYPVTGKSVVIQLKNYFGPKELTLLRSVDPTLDHVVDLGMFTVIAYPLLNLLKLFYAWFKNYGVAIILLTLLVKIVLYPLTFKSMKSMKEIAKVQPQMQRLREKYKDDKEALNREMLNLMRNHGYNPMAGCLPIFIQMPVFFALYRVLYSSIELYHAPFVFWLQDLSAKDPFYVTPVLLTLTMFVQQKLSPQTATDPAQQKMMQFMPIMFGAFMIGLPSGLTIYMLVNALASIAQQAYINKKLGGPAVQYKKA